MVYSQNRQKGLQKFSYSKAEFSLSIFIILYVLFTYFFLTSRSEQVNFSIASYSTLTYRFLPIVLLLAASLRLAYVMFFIRPDKLFKFYFQNLMSVIPWKLLLLNLIPTFLLLSVFMSAFTSVKVAIPYTADYRWDEFFSRMDQSLHLGVFPWEISHRVFDSHLFTFLLNLSYNFWFFVLIGFILWFSFDFRNRGIRARFLWTFSLSWVVLGNLAANLFASGGPCYYDFFVPEAPYNPYRILFERLADANNNYPIWALQTQERLLSQFQNLEGGIGAGISAMPSMHLSMATLFVCAAFALNKFAGWIFLAYLILIMVGSVHLGWHYAVDGYASIILTASIWLLTRHRWITSAS